MRADDERDPLDRWLNQQVQPLPPPPGTFELITRRARGRRLRRLAVTVVSAAAVAAAVAVAVPVGLSLHLSPTPAKGSYVADGSSTTPTGTQGPNGSATPDTTPSTPAATATQPVIAPSGPVPANFQPTSITFVSAQTGWVIGQAGTPGQCDNKDPYICTSIARTNDAGQTWQGGHAPSTSGPSGPNGVSGIRFLNPTDGWAFGPELWSTHDAGNTWTKIDTLGQRVTDLETVGDRAFALWAYCPDGGSATSAQAADIASGCTSYTLMSTPAGADDWKAVGGATSGLTANGNATSAVLALTGTTGYLIAPDGTLYSGPLDAAWQKVSTVPCEPAAAQPDGLPSAALLAVQDATNLAVACSGSSFAGGLQVFISSDGGSLWTPQAATAWSGISSTGTPTSLTAAPNGTLALATSTGIYFLPAGGAHWKPTSATGARAPEGGFNYVGMTTDAQGVAVPADTSLHEIWMTFNGGELWTPATPITPVN
jgi:hypothetical protein